MNVHVPIQNAEEDKKYKYYELPENVYKGIPKQETTMILRNCNTMIGKEVVKTMKTTTYRTVK